MKQLIIFALLLFPSNLFGGFLDPIVTVDVLNNLGHTSKSWEVPNHTSDKAKFILGQKEELKNSGGQTIATIDNLEVSLEGDPVVNLSFAVGAGPSTTIFTITTGLVSFSPLTAPNAFASAGITVTDSSPYPGNGADIAGVFPSSTLFQAQYNGGSPAFDFVGPLSIGGAGSASGSSSTTLITLPGIVVDISSKFQFILTADDLASGTSRFEVIPVPEPQCLSQAIIFGLCILYYVWLIKR